MSSQSRKLYAKPPTTVLGVATNRDITNSIVTNRIEAKSINANLAKTDVLVDLDDVNLLSSETLLLEESASQESPETGRGRIWVRDDTPSTPIFTNDAGDDIVMPVTLTTVLSIDSEADAQSMENLAYITFNSNSIVIGRNDAPATATTSGVVIGAGSTLAGTGYVVGASSSSISTSSTVLGRGNTMLDGGEFADAEPSVVIGVDNSTTPGGICIGRSLRNITRFQDFSSSQNVLIGSTMALTTDEDAYSVAVGHSISVSMRSVFVGNGCGSVGTTDQEHQIGIGRLALTRGKGDIAIGMNATAGVLDSAASRAIAIGTSAAASAQDSIAIGTSASSTNNYTIALGTSSSASGNYAVAIGHASSAAGDYSVAVGYSASSPYESSTAIGANVHCRAPREFATLGWRMMTATVTTADDTQTTLITLPTAENENWHLEGTVLARRSVGIVSGESSFLAVLRRYNIRNKGQTVTQSSGTGSELIDRTNGAAGLLVDINESGQNVLIQVTGNPAETWVWTAIINIYASPLA